MLLKQGLGAGRKYLLKRGSWDPGWERGRGRRSPEATERPGAAGRSNKCSSNGDVEAALRRMKSLCFCLFCSTSESSQMWNICPEWRLPKALQSPRTIWKTTRLSSVRWNQTNTARRNTRLMIYSHIQAGAIFQRSITKQRS